MLKNIFFDLDGTLTDSAPGIMNSIRYALEKMDYPIPDEDTLRLFVGPPLTDSYMEVCGMTEEEAFKGLELYRVYFADKGMFENLPYPGIKECLKELKDKGFRMFLATSKPEEYAKIIMDHFELSEYFCDICGASMDEKRNTKDAVIQYCMDKNNIAPEETIMIGDRFYDVEGAKVFGIPCIGVLYGYGSEEELRKVGAAYIAETPEKIPLIIDGIR